MLLEIELWRYATRDRAMEILAGQTERGSDGDIPLEIELWLDRS